MGFSRQKLRNYYLLNPEESGEQCFKLILSQTDKTSLISILEDGTPPKEHSIRIGENMKFFQKKLADQKEKLEIVWKGIAKLTIVDISLDRSHDNPQLIFESMNSTGKALSQADLIRNFVLMGLEQQLQTRLYERYWRPMERYFEQEAHVTHFDKFMRHYLTMRNREAPKIGKVYDAFKRYSQDKKVAAEGIEALVSDLCTYAEYFHAMAFGIETDYDLNHAFQDLRDLKVDVAYPLLLELYHDYRTQILSRKEFLQAIRTIESYVFRRAICEIPTNSLNKTFPSIGRSLKKEQGHYLESLEAAFLLLPSYRRFPRDDEFKDKLRNKDVYNFLNRSYLLRKLENHERKERASINEYTIEHILPQFNNDAEGISDVWRRELGDDWKNVWEKYRHTLGNLTLTGYNSEYSNHSFGEKCNMEGGFVHSPLRLNKNIGTESKWNKESIERRAADLADKAILVWRTPALDTKLLNAYRPVLKNSPIGYTIDHHRYLDAGPIRELFEAFRKQVLGLDPMISEEFLKFYIAYKAETNFVDVEPQASRLRLTLNMTFPEINDPRDLCRDISAIGRWGNGDVEVSLSSFNELPYVLGLVRQSFEKQMGNEIDG